MSMMVEIKESGKYETHFHKPLCYNDRQGWWVLKRGNPGDGLWGKEIARTWWYFDKYDMPLNSGISAEYERNMTPR